MSEKYPFEKLFSKEMAQKNLSDELGLLLSKLPDQVPAEGTVEHDAYLRIQHQIRIVKQKVCKTHEELMDLVRAEEEASRKFSGIK